MSSAGLTQSSDQRVALAWRLQAGRVYVLWQLERSQQLSRRLFQLAQYFAPS